MDRLTPEQAKLLREHRPTILRTAGELAAVSVELSDACAHNSRDPACPVCRVYFAVSEADAALNDLEDDLDRMLLDGPNP